MDDDFKTNLVTGLFILSAVSLVTTSLIDYHMGLGLFHISNPLADEDWMLTFVSLVLVLLSFKMLLRHYKAGTEMTVVELQKQKRLYLIIMGLYVFIFALSFIDLKMGPTNTGSLVIDYKLHHDEDILVAFVSLFSLFLFLNEIVRIDKKIVERKK